MSMLHRFMYFTAACALFAPVVYVFMTQAAQIVA